MIKKYTIIENIEISKTIEIEVTDDMDEHDISAAISENAYQEPIGLNGWDSRLLNSDYWEENE